MITIMIKIMIKIKITITIFDYERYFLSSGAATAETDGAIRIFAKEEIRIFP